MVFGVEDSKRLICPVCNWIVTELVPMYDNDQQHTNTMLCKSCKRAIKAGKEIKKFKRDPGIYAQMETELNKKSGKREVVAPK